MAPSEAANVLGYVAAAVGSVLMLPQVVQSWRTRRVDEIAMGMILLYLLNCSLWLGYGVLVGSGPVGLANAAGLALGGCQLGLKLRYSGTAG